MIEPLVNIQTDELITKIELNGMYGYTYFEYDLEWGYTHETLFNDYLWWDNW